MFPWKVLNLKIYIDVIYNSTTNFDGLNIAISTFSLNNKQTNV